MAFLFSIEISNANLWLSSFIGCKSQLTTKRLIKPKWH